jgi:hypothetical protein
MDLDGYRFTISKQNSGLNDQQVAPIPRNTQDTSDNAGTNCAAIDNIKPIAVNDTSTLQH